jgi:hypothetical protein
LHQSPANITRLFCSTICPATLGLLLALSVHAETNSGGYVDLGQFSPPKSGGEFVEVNLKGNLLALATRVAKTQEPEVAQLLEGIESIRVNVIGLNDENRTEIQGRVTSLRTDLGTQGWERVVTVQEEGQDVGVYLKAKGQDAIAGLVVTVLDGKNQAVFVNVVGDIKPEKIAELGEHFHIAPLKKAGEAIEKK